MTVAEDGVGVDWTPLLEWALTPTGLAVLGGLALTIILVGLLAGWMIYRSIRRRLPAGLADRVLATAKASAVQGQLRSLPPGPRRDLVALRARLQRESELTTAAAVDGPGDVSSLTHRLRDACATIDAELAGLMREADEARLEAALPAASRRVEDLCALAVELRDAMHESRAGFSEDQTTSLTRDVTNETLALRAGIDRLRQLRG